MIFSQTPLAGAFVIDPTPVADERGLFARTYCTHEFERAGLDPTVAQCSTSFNARRGTLRGMHYQEAPHAESKLVRCTRGGIYDVMIDLRPDSATFRSWFAVELTEDNRRSLFVPRGFAHGFQTLTDRTEVYYQISEPYEAAASRGVRWNDPAFNITWPDAVRTISERDQSYPDFWS